MTIKALILSLIAASAASAAVAAPLREVRGAWLAPGVEPEASVSAVERFADANFNTLYLRMESAAGVAWYSAYAPSTLTASMSRSDVPAAVLDAAHDRSLRTLAIISPDPEADPDDLLSLYREMLLAYDFDGLLIDTDRLAGLDENERHDLIDRLTLGIIGDFPALTMAAAVSPDRSGDSAHEASRLLADGIVEGVVVKNDGSVPFGVLSDLWGDIPGVTVTFDDARAADARFMPEPWGIAWNAPDATECRNLSSTIFGEYAHLPANALRPTVPGSPASAEQRYSGSEYLLTWTAPEWTDDDAPVVYYSVYDASTGLPVVAKTAGTEISIPSDNPYRRFAVTAWDYNYGESEPMKARAVADDISDELMPDASDVEISCLDGELRLASRAVLGTVDIYNLEGLQVKSRRINRNSASIRCSDLAPGVYIVSVKNPEGTVCSKKFLLK